MTIYLTSVRLHAKDTARAKDTALSLARGLQDALGKAASFTDPHLSPEGLAAKRAELAGHFREAARTDLENTRRTVTAASEYLRNAVDENVVAPTDPGAAIRLEQKWRQAERMLDAGIEARDVLKGADELMTRAILEFGPSWAAATGHKPRSVGEAIGDALSSSEAPAPGAWLTRQARARLAEVTSDASLAELLALAGAAEAQVAAAQPYLDAAENLIADRPADMLGAAIASHFATTGPAEADEPAETDSEPAAAAAAA